MPDRAAAFGGGTAVMRRAPSGAVSASC